MRCLPAFAHASARQAASLDMTKARSDIINRCFVRCPSAQDTITAIDSRYFSAQDSEAFAPQPRAS
jgi:hypothetical protein